MVGLAFLVGTWVGCVFALILFMMLGAYDEE